MSLGSNNPFPKVILVEQGSTPSSPSSGDQKLFIDSDDHHLKRVDSLGNVVDIEGGTVSTGGSGGTVLTGSIYVAVCNGRLTTESGVAVSTSDRSSQGTLYFTPYNGDQISLYTGSEWITVQFSELSVSLSGIVSGKNYDVFVGYHSGSPQTAVLSLGPAWTSDTARANALTTISGVPYLQDGSPSSYKRWVGTIRASGNDVTEDSLIKRFVWNAFNQVTRQMAVYESTSSWNYTVATWRPANNNSANAVAWVTGDASSNVQVTVSASTTQTSAGNVRYVGVGIDSTTAPAAPNLVNPSGNNNRGSAVATYIGTPGLGYHSATWLEESAASGTTTFAGDVSVAGTTVHHSGMQGTIAN